MALHTTSRYDEELNDLKSHVLSMGERVQAAIDRAAELIFQPDRSTAQHTIEHHRIVNALELECDEMTRNLIVRRQPAGSDLRFIIACNKIVTDLERMGDLAAGICRSALRIGNHPVPDLDAMPLLIEKVRRQVARVLGAYAHDDVHEALGTVSGSHTYAGPDSYTVTVTVTDDDGDAHADTFGVTVSAVSTGSSA